MMKTSRGERGELVIPTEIDRWLFRPLLCDISGLLEA